MSHFKILLYPREACNQKIKIALNKHTISFSSCIRPSFVCFLQEDKEALFDVCDTLDGVLQVASGTLSTLKVSMYIKLSLIFASCSCMVVNSRSCQHFYASANFMLRLSLAFRQTIRTIYM